jgi:hypothetical protein
MARRLPGDPGTDPAEALRDYLTRQPTRSAHLLAQKAVVLIDPASRRSEVVWPAPW